MLVTLVVVAMLLLIRTVGGHPLQKHQNFLYTACALVVSLIPESLGLQEKREGRQHRVRTRKFVDEIFEELGPYYVRRAYRMEGASFWKLCRLLRPFVVNCQEVPKWRQLDSITNKNQCCSKVLRRWVSI
jgi:hypothetical protein